MTSILVTGGAGFIGMNLVRRLLDGGQRVRILDLVPANSDRHATLDGADYVEGDVRDPKTAARAVEGMSTVIHLAAAGSVVESIADPMANFDINARGTLTMLHACANSDVEKFVFASTGGALIGNATPPVNEQSLPWPISPYGASKLCGEAYCHAFAGSYGISTVALRFANVYGPWSDHKRGAVTKFINAALDGEPITIFGDGNASRDFLYVDDLCAGIMAAVDADLKDDVLHLASGVETSVLELAQQILELAGRSDLKIKREPARQGEVERNFADGSYAASELGFRPQISLAEGLRQTIDWFATTRSGAAS